MKVKLISNTQNLLDVIYTGATTCYNAGSPIDKWFDVCNIPTDKKIKLIDACIKSGHTSVLEHTQFMFAIEGVSRACTHQLVRHRIGMSYSQQSQRYVEIKEDELFEFNIPDSIKNDEELHNEFYALMQHIKNFYTKASNKGIKAEDCRSVLPNACCTNIVLTCNLRSLIHLCHERLCARAQKEIRLLTKEMVKLVVKDNEWLRPYLVPKCEALGYCQEKNGCRRKPTLEQLKEKWFNDGYNEGYEDNINLKDV